MKVIGVGLNYRDHASEVELELPKQPLLFANWENAQRALHLLTVHNLPFSALTCREARTRGARKGRRSRGVTPRAPTRGCAKLPGKPRER